MYFTCNAARCAIPLAMLKEICYKHRMNFKTRQILERLVWKHTHADFKGKRDDGTKTILHFVSGVGTCSFVIGTLTDQILIDKLPSEIRENLYMARAIFGTK